MDSCVILEMQLWFWDTKNVGGTTITVHHTSKLLLPSHEISPTSIFTVIKKIHLMFIENHHLCAFILFCPYLLLHISQTLNKVILVKDCFNTIPGKKLD